MTSHSSPLTLASARPMEDGREYKTKVGLLTGVLLCAGSSALVIWLVTLLF